MPEGYAANWAAAVLSGVVGFLAIALMFLASLVLAPRHPSVEKGIPYESGIRPAPYIWSQMHVRYYIFGILFLVFDVEAVFLFPWAVVYLKSTPAVFYEMLIFLGVLFFGIVYAWRKGVLQWR